MKFSLHIGVDQYDPKYYGGNINLKQCVNDAKKMKAVCMQMGVSDDDQYLIQDQSATVGMFHSCIELLADTSQPGDTVIITFSGHGTFKDLPGNMRATAICLHDGILWDFQMAELLRYFKKGVTVVWIADCCHAESNSRDEQTPDLLPRSTPLPESATITPTQADLSKVECSILAMSACRVDQIAYEDKNGGVFTRILKDTVLTKPEGTYSQLFRKMEKSMGATRQTPVWEFWNFKKKSKQIFS
jgi:hypothetical protein